MIFFAKKKKETYRWTRSWASYPKTQWRLICHCDLPPQLPTRVRVLYKSVRILSNCWRYSSPIKLQFGPVRHWNKQNNYILHQDFTLRKADLWPEINKVYNCKTGFSLCEKNDGITFQLSQMQNIPNKCCVLIFQRYPGNSFNRRSMTRYCEMVFSSGVPYV